MQPLDNNAALRNFSALVDFSNLINSTLDLNFSLNNILLTCFGKFHTTKGMIALLNDENYFEVKVSKGIPNNIIAKFPKIAIHNYETSGELSTYIEENNFPIVKDIKSSEGLKGILILGQR